MAITREQALDCFRSDDLIGIGMEADAVRRALHPEGVVSYGMAHAVACAGRADEQIHAEIRAAQAMGATGIFLAQLPADFAGMEQLVAGIRRRFPQLWLQGLSAAELATLPGAIPRLRDAGLDSIGGASAEIPNDTWLAVHQAAHQAGMRTTAHIVFGAGETLEQRLDQFDAIRRLQQQTGGFAALAPASFHAVNGRELDETTAVEYLKTLAVARIYLDNIENLQSDWTTQGLKVLQMGLRFGANDAGNVQVERTKGATEEEIRRVIRDAGFRPAQRELGYRAMLV